MAKLLIIEDSELVQKTYKRMFKTHEIQFVTTGLGAIQLLENGQYDAVISDGDLEDQLSGLDVWLWVQNNRKDLLPKFIFCSGNIHIGEYCEKQGIPFNDKSEPKALIETVNKMLEVAL